MTLFPSACTGKHAQQRRLTWTPLSSQVTTVTPGSRQFLAPSEGILVENVFLHPDGYARRVRKVKRSLNAYGSGEVTGCELIQIDRY